MSFFLTSVNCAVRQSGKDSQTRAAALEETESYALLSPFDGGVLDVEETELTVHLLHAVLLFAATRPFTAFLTFYFSCVRMSDSWLDKDRASAHRVLVLRFVCSNLPADTSLTMLSTARVCCTAY